MPRNVYILTASGLRASHLSSYLYQNSQTPALDFLAYDGIRFLNAFSTSSESLPAHLSLLTGLYPFHRNLRDAIDGLMFEHGEPELSVVTIPQWFQKRGYRTAIFAADPELQYPSLFKSWFHEASVGAYDPKTECRIAREWILQNKNAPQFVLLNFAEPTLPFQPPAPFDRHYANHPYDGEIAGLDREVAILINSLKRAGLFERSIVVFTSPFGESLEGSIRTGSVAESIIRVPLFIAAPGILPRHQEYESAVSLVDIFPTLLRLFEAKDSGAFDGTALFKKGSDEQTSRQWVFGESRMPKSFGLPPIYFVRSRQSQYTSDAADSESELKKALERKLAAQGLTWPVTSYSNGLQSEAPVVENP